MGALKSKMARTNNNGDDAGDRMPLTAGSGMARNNSSDGGGILGSAEQEDDYVYSETAATGCLGSKLVTLYQVEVTEVRERYSKQREFEMSMHGLLMIGHYLWIVVASSVALFHHKVYGQHDSACSCVLVNHWFGLSMMAMAYACMAIVPSILLHDPDAGAYGCADHIVEADQARTWTNVFRRPHTSLLVSILSYAFLSSGFAMLVPLTGILFYYIGFGMGFCFLFLGTCRAGCDSLPIKHTAKWGGRNFVEFYRVVFSEDVMDVIPGGAGGWGYQGRHGNVEHGIVQLTKMMIFMLLLHYTIGLLSDVVFYFRIIRRRIDFLQRRVARGIGT